MKSYEANEKVNYADLEHSDVGDVKDYGPCTSSYCSCSNYELRQQLRQAKEDIDKFGEKFKEYDTKGEAYKSSVEKKEENGEDRGRWQKLGGVVVDAIPIPFLGTAYSEKMDGLNQLVDGIHLLNRKDIYDSICDKYNEVKKWYYGVRNRM